MKKKRTIGCLVGIVALGVLAICLVAGFFWVGIREYKNLPRLVSGIDFGAYSPDVYSYSPEQAQVINEIGSPRSFLILFYHDQDPDGKKVYVRYENWFYPDLGTSLTFENGLLLSEESMEPYAAAPTQYEPAIFTAFMNRESLATAAGIDEWFILPVEEELLVDADLYYADGLTFGLQSGDLVYLEAVGFEDPNAPAVVLPEEPEVILTPEERAAEGVHQYYAVFSSEDDGIEEGRIPVEITFYEGGMQLILDGEVGAFTRLGLNQFITVEDDGFQMTFTSDGFILHYTEDLNEVEITFTREE